MRNISGGGTANNPTISIVPSPGVWLAKASGRALDPIITIKRKR